MKNTVSTRTRARASRTAQRQSGLSLVELMVALSLGAVLLGGLIQMFVGNKRVNEVHQAANSLQENGRYAMKLMSDSLRAADHWGGVESSDVDGTPAVTGIGSCNSAWITNVDEGIRGFEGGATSPLPAGCIAAADYVANTDVFVVRHAGGEYQPTATVSGGDANAIWVRTAVGRHARLYKASDLTSLPADLYDSSDVDATGLYNYPYQATVYFIRPCSAKAGAACAASDDSGRPVRTLARLVLIGNQLQEQAVVNGVEDMQIEYGVDSDLDTNADYYADASAVPATQWNRVVSVRFAFVVRSEERGDIDDTNTYTLPGGNTFTPPAADKRYSRKVFTSVIHIRNRSRS